MSERLSKFLSRAGVCSRRDAEKYILDGRIRLNHDVVTTPVTFVTSADTVFCDGKPIAPPEALRIWKYYKPVGLITTHKDPEGRPTVFEAFQHFIKTQSIQRMPHIMSVGRLDVNSEGLLLLTNSGGFSRFAEHPSTGWQRTYKVRVFGDVDEAMLASLEKGITVEGVHYKGMKAVLSRQSGKNAWLLITLWEGKNREIRNVMNHLGLRVNRLIRLSYGPFDLGNLQPRTFLECERESIFPFLDQ